MGHDVIVDRYARLYEQPYQLARLGHDVLGVCLSYRPCQVKDEIHDAIPGRLRWLGLSPGKNAVTSFVGLLDYPRQALIALREFSPDIVVAASDCPHVILGRWLSRRLGVHYAADLYDHFESFGLSRLPRVVPLYRHALRSADIVSCVSEPLSDLVRNSYCAKGRVVTLPSTINQDVFFSRDKTACRSALSLPLQGKFIGTAGGLSADKGIEPLYRAFETLVAQDPSVHLVLAGNIDSHCLPPIHPNVHFLGRITHADTALLFNALDVGVVYIRDTPYGRFSFPQKAYEMAACAIPMAVARVGYMESLFKETPCVFYESDDAASLTECVKDQLARRQIARLDIPSWAQQATELSSLFALATEKPVSLR